MHLNDAFKWHPVLTINKYAPETVQRVSGQLGRQAVGADLAGLTPDEVTVCEGNELTTAGLGYIAHRICGTGSKPALDITRTVIGVGNSATAFNASQTDLVGASKRFEVVAAAPGVSGSVISTSATFEAGDGNFAWEEWCLVATTSAAADSNTKPAGDMINRKVQSLGTKAAGAVWTLSVSITLS